MVKKTKAIWYHEGILVFFTYGGDKTVEEKDTYSSYEVAEIVGVTDLIIRECCDKGKYPNAFKTTNGLWRIPKRLFKVKLEDAIRRRDFENKLNKFNDTF